MTKNALALALSMLCRRCGRKMVLMPEKLEAQMNGGLCRDCARHQTPVGGYAYLE